MRWQPRQSAGVDRPRSPAHGTRDRKGSAAIEFAVIAPLMLTALAGVYDITIAMILREEVFTAAHGIVAAASNLAVRPDKTTSLTVPQVQQALSSIYAAMPMLRNGRATGVRSAVLTSVDFQQSDPSCVPSGTVTCAYLAYAIWSVAYADPPGRLAGGAAAFQPLTRCPGGHTPLNQVSPAQYGDGDMTSVPTQNVTSPVPVLIADVHYQYTPLFFGYFMTGPVDFWVSSLWPVRSVNSLQASAVKYTQYDLANAAGGVGQCP